jgi:integrase
VKSEGGVCFRTKYGNSWEGKDKSNPISAEFRKVADACGVKVGFYALRHTCETIGGRCNDQVAVDFVMGHVTPGMAAVYREEIDDERVKAVGLAIQQWMG